MRIGKIKQFGLIIGCLFSLLVSSVSGCTCHHGLHHTGPSEHVQSQPPHSHEVKDIHEVKEKASHSHEVPAKASHSHDDKGKAPHSHHKAAPVEPHHNDDSAEDETVSCSLSEQECCCIKPAPQVFAKADKFKFAKIVAAILPASLIQTEIAPKLISLNLNQFIKPFYLSDSFYNLSPGRAPPRF